MERVRELLRSDEGGGARALGGLLLAVGVLVLLFRRTAFEDPWDNGVVFWIIFLTALFLYGAGFYGARLTVGTRNWQRAFVVFGLILIPFAGFTFIEWIDGNTGASLNVAWIFALTAAAGFAVALIADLRVGRLLGGLALIVAWLAVWDELLDDGLGGDIGTFRGLLLVIALILLAVAALVALRGRPLGGGSDLVTAAGIAAVFGAGVLSVSGTLATFPFVSGGAEDTNLFWDLVLLISSLSLVAYGSVSGFRGPAYVGAIGLTLFIYVVGLDLDDSSPAGKVLGWPLVLLLVAGGLLVLSVLPALRRPPDTLAPAAPPPPPADPPTQAAPPAT